MPNPIDSEFTLLSPPTVDMMRMQEMNQLIDVRSRADYDAGHIPGSVYLDTSSFRATVDGVGGQVAPREMVEATLEATGVDANKNLIFVGSVNDTGTSRALWTLAYYGVNGTLSLLDGGFSAWTDMGLMTTTEHTATASLDWAGQATVLDYRVDKEWVLDNLDEENVRLFDVRSPDEYNAGHIPGATNVNWTENLTSRGRFDALESIRTRHGSPENKTLVVYCQSGARASVSWTVLKAAGFDDVRLYDGSWNEWGADPNTPKQN